VKIFNVWGLVLRKDKIIDLENAYKNSFIDGVLLTRFFETREQARKVYAEHYKPVKVDIIIHD
jgi:hypothetical protein